MRSRKSRKILRLKTTATLTLGGIAAGDLAEIYGTPLGVIDLGVVEASLGSIAAPCKNYGVGISYAGKAFLAIEFARFLSTHDIGLDVCSLGELAVAERAGFPPERLTLHGAGKTRDELQAALDGRVGRIVVDGLDELRALCDLTAAKPCQVLLRLNTGIEAHAHAYVRTSGNRTKFGLCAEEEREAAALIAASPLLRLRGLHAHIGSQIHDSAAFIANAEALVDAAARFAALNHPIETIVVGGGFGVPEKPEEATADIGSIIRDVIEAVARRAAERELAAPAVEIEPGRAIVAAAGTTVYRVISVKQRAGRTIVVIDGGMGDNPRPALYDAYHHIVPVEPSASVEHDVVVYGKSCENDELGTARLGDDIAAGSLLAMQNTGAYTYSMASNYNRFPRPAVVAVHNGKHCVLLRRETLEDVLRADADVPALHIWEHAASARSRGSL